MSRRSLIWIALCFVALPATADVVSRPSANGVAKSMDCLAAALQSKGLTVFARIDHAAGARRAGMRLRPSQLLIFGNPKVGTPLMQAEPLAGLDLPLKVLAWEDHEGKVWLSYQAPADLAARHGITGRQAVIDKMAGALARFTAAAAAPGCARD